MDLDLTDEQRMLADSVGTLLEKRYDANARLALLTSDEGWSRDLWKQYADLGVLGLTVDEKHGGAGMGPDELAVVMERFGRSLVLEPFFGTVVLAASLIERAGSAEQRDDLLPRIAAGELVCALAASERASRWSLTDVATTAIASGDAWTVSGEKVAVVGGDAADVLIVTAALPDGGVGLFLIDTVDSADVTRDSHPMQDGTRGADVRFDNAPATPLGDGGDATEVLADVVDVATAMLCAEAVGAMDRMLWLTVDYLKTRVQFGQPIAVFQALQHRASDMYVSLEQSRSMALLARLALADDDVAARRRAVRAAKIQIDTACRHIGQEAIQLHGGIGMTMEYPVGHYVKRTAVIAKTFADTDYLVGEVGSAGGLFA